MSLSQTLEIKNQRGLHARAAAKFVKTAAEYDCTNIKVTKGGQEVCGNSIMGLLMLAASIGTSIEVTTQGPKEEQALSAIAQLVNDKFGED
ncbi:phosphohistidinoprotein-hexose phosphotransferase component of N-regulated PTS system (Npr) [Candidatus Terasakiella magnetica]|uniref:Phosphohistidinoprotein-hexose phosphotransferase component of N-regulated PTS system (Npr) n=1 Tax=Candidatus Terasakiella magnetica TaxID=1867952 RepID=A0A1C3RLP9_9PROT|nr:HPr family phosphocarrier protein [Candidatus Terasakiella magnetica]SCA58230.1 phosphohistidinoprotein-hexose phosphotransferase component of N-regulated PTS system (Npr) [Candidatus Terasakiella magnetica]